MAAARPALGLRRAEPVPYCVADEANGVVYAELPHDPAAVGLRRLDADVQEAGHLTRPVALGDQL